MSLPYGYLPHTPEDLVSMQAALGIGSVQELFRDVPESVRLGEPLPLPPPLAEGPLLEDLRTLARKNWPVSRALSFLGAGAYHHFIPSAIPHLIFRGEFYTAYTPYQPEVSQGTLQAIYEFQSMICHLTGMEAANASHYDGATALAEGALMALGETGRPEIVISRGVHPEYRAVTATYLQERGTPLIPLPLSDGVTDLEELGCLVSDRTAAVIIQYPNFLGRIEELAPLAETAHRRGALFLVALGDPVTLGLLSPPGELGADIVTGEGQPLGVPVSFGGPYIGFIACRSALVRRLPGRIVGVTTDLDGKRAFVLTLQAREQHIRREKAASNICTNQGLCALAVTVFLSLLGPEGLKEMADLCYQKAHYAFRELAAIPGVEPLFAGPFFHEFALRFPLPVDRLTAPDGTPIFLGYNLGREFPELGGARLLCVTETVSRDAIDRTVAAVKAHLAGRRVPA